MELGATHTFTSMEEAVPKVMEMTWGQMADRVIMTPGVLYGELGGANELCGKGGTMVVTGIAPITQTEASVNLFQLAMWQKEIKGTIFGSLNPRADIPGSWTSTGRVSSSSTSSSPAGTRWTRSTRGPAHAGRTNIRGVIVFG